MYLQNRVPSFAKQKWHTKIACHLLRSKSGTTHYFQLKIHSLCKFSLFLGLTHYDLQTDISVFSKAILPMFEALLKQNVNTRAFVVYDDETRGEEWFSGAESLPPGPPTPSFMMERGRSRRDRPSDQISRARGAKRREGGLRAIFRSPKKEEWAKRTIGPTERSEGGTSWGSEATETKVKERSDWTLLRLSGAKEEYWGGCGGSSAPPT